MNESVIESLSELVNRVNVWSYICRSRRLLHTLLWLQKLKHSGRKTFRSVSRTRTYTSRVVISGDAGPVPTW